MDNKEEEQKPKLKMSSLREALGIFEFVLPYRWPYIIGLVLLVGAAILIVPFLKDDEIEGPYAKFNFEQIDLAVQAGQSVNLKIDLLLEDLVVGDGQTRQAVTERTA